VLARFLQIHTVERAIYRDFTLRAAADRADLAAHAGTGTARPPHFADGASHSPSIEVEAGALTRRTLLFFKVDIEHDEEESPEKLGAEIRRALMKIYGVQEAELSSFTTVED
jgi:hypothetical protein